MRTFLAAALVLAWPAVAHAAPALVPRPAALTEIACAHPVALNRPLRFARGVDAGGFELLRERWQALGIPAPRPVRPGEAADVIATTLPASAQRTDEAYRLSVPGDGAPVAYAVPRGAAAAQSGFDALATLAQLAQRDAGGWSLPCVRIEDAPAMRWRVLSDDVSRGPFPTMNYAKERIRTLASLKYNGWSPYMEQVLADPRYPFVAWPNGWTAAQLGELSAYARRFHVALIPEQQTFAHMHETLKWEQLAPLAELPHGYLLAESDPRTYEYLRGVVRTAAQAARPAPFVHLGSDEPLDLGRGRTPRTAQAFGEHVTRVARMLAGSGARPMIWDDAIQQDAAILALIPRETAIVTFHYGVEKTYRPYIDRIANAGFEQMVSPGAANWNEIYPDLGTAYTNVARFAGEAKGTRGMLGTFMTVWHDDGESLYEATWPAVAYAAASAWQAQPVDDASWHQTFSRAFWGTSDAALPRALDALAAVRELLRTTPSDPPDYVFWHDPFDPRLQARARGMDLAALRARAETALTALWQTRPPLHPQAAAVMRLAALRYDQLGRRLQIGSEAPAYYADGRAQAVKPNSSPVYRSLNVAKYLCWELRDGLTALEPLYAAAWRYESTEPGLARVLVRYHDGEAAAQRCADRIDAVERENYLRAGTVPSWDEVMSSTR